MLGSHTAYQEKTPPFPPGTAPRRFTRFNPLQLRAFSHRIGYALSVYRLQRTVRFRSSRSAVFDFEVLLM